MAADRPLAELMLSKVRNCIRLVAEISIDGCAGARPRNKIPLAASRLTFNQLTLCQLGL